MELMLFSVLDTKVGLYARPFTARNKPEAMRSFGEIAKDASHPIGAHPEDYILYYIGIFSEQTGKVHSETHEALAKAIDLLRPSQPELPEDA